MESIRAGRMVVLGPIALELLDASSQDLNRYAALVHSLGSGKAHRLSAAGEVAEPRNDECEFHRKYKVYSANAGNTSV
jgi:hypothetical protein